MRAAVSAPRSRQSKAARNPEHPRQRDRRPASPAITSTVGGAPPKNEMKQQHGDRSKQHRRVNQAHGRAARRSRLSTETARPAVKRSRHAMFQRDARRHAHTATVAADDFTAPHIGLVFSSRPAATPPLRQYGRQRFRKSWLITLIIAPRATFVGDDRRQSRTPVIGAPYTARRGQHRRFVQNRPRQLRPLPIPRERSGWADRAHGESPTRAKHAVAAAIQCCRGRQLEKNAGFRALTNRRSERGSCESSRQSCCQPHSIEAWRRPTIEQQRAAGRSNPASPRPRAASICPRHFPRATPSHAQHEGVSDTSLSARFVP